MPNVSIGRRIVRAAAGAISLGSLFYVIGQIALAAVPALPATLPLQLLSIGASSAVLVELSADIDAIAKQP